MEDPKNLLFKYFANECSAEEEKVIINWRYQSAENDFHFTQSEKIWQQARIDGARFNPDVSNALNAINRRINTRAAESTVGQNSRIRSLWQYSRRIAATLTIGFIVVFFSYLGYKQLSHTQTARIVTDAAQKSEVVLADGTRVWINKNSTFSYPQSFDGTIREVFLDGEAYFEVAKDHRKPFVIHASGSVTRVVGTAFNVRARSQEKYVVVSVTSGNVVFYEKSNEEAKVFLTKNEKGTLDTSTKQVTKTSNSDANFLAWQTGTLIFDNAALGDVAAALSNYYGRNISVDSNLTACRLTSTYSRQSLEDVLNELVIIQNVKVVKIENAIVLKGKGC
jgi:ferric-dicitrate binding protein FerR (iron transport regulator)